MFGGRRGIRLAFMAAALLLIAAVTWVGCGMVIGGHDLNIPTGSNGSGAKMSAAMTAYVDDAMPKLEKIVKKWNGGDQAGAAKLWKSIGDTPVATDTDLVVSKDYLEYANNVRYYMIGDGSATLKDVEDSRAKAKATLADLRP